MDTLEKKMTDPGIPNTNSAWTLRIPKLNLQAGILGLVALITLFQTVQLFRISGAASGVSAHTSAPSSSSSQGTGSNASTPQSMVGGC